MIIWIDPYMVEPWAVVEDQGGSGPVVHVKLIDISGVDIGEDVAIDNNERFVVPEIFNILDATPGAQDGGFMPGHNRDAIGLLFHELVNHMAQVVGVYDNSFTSGVLKPSNQDVNQGAVKDWKEGFWLLFRQRQQTGAQAGRQDHRFHKAAWCQYTEFVSRLTVSTEAYLCYWPASHAMAATESTKSQVPNNK
jgi:hypothetical protein